MNVIKLNSLKWLALGLVCFVSACSPPGAQPVAPTAGAGPSGGQEAAERTSVSNSSQARPTPVAEIMPTPVSEQVTTQATLSATPTPGRANTPAPETPMPDVEATAEDAMPVEEAMPSEEDRPAEEAMLDKPAAQPGPSEEQRWLLASLQSRGPAPELSNEVWLNSEPLKLADLGGKVVLIDFWTFG